MRATLLVLLSAALYTLAFPPWQLSSLASIALVPLLYAVRQLPAAAAAGAGLLWGTAAIWGVGYWVPAALATYYDQPLWFGVLFSLGASIVFAGWYTAAFAACASWASARSRGVPRAALLAALWVTWELARARLLTGDPWLLLGYGLVPHPLWIQAADVGGVYLLSFVLAFVNAAVAELLPLQAARARRAAPALASAGALALAVVAYGTWRLRAALPSDHGVPVTIVQANTDLGAQWREELYGRGLQNYLRLSRAAAERRPPQLLVWPESAVSFFVAHEPRYQAVIGRELAPIGAELILGAPHYEDGDPARPQFFNSAFYLDAGGEIRGRYDKSHLLPFAEYFPLRAIWFLNRQFERVRYFTPGAGDTLLHTRIGAVAAVICFEGIFPELVRRAMASGAVLLVNLSNDAWLGAGAGPQQHLQMVALRAVENRTWIIRATTTGISAFIDPYGRIAAATPTFTATTLDGEITPLSIATLYKSYGDVFALACLLASAGGLLAIRRLAPPSSEGRTVSRPRTR